MKQLFVILFLIAFTISGYSQDKEATIEAGKTKSASELNFTAEDVVTAAEPEYIVQYFAGQHTPSTQDVIIQMDSIDVPNIDVTLQGSKFGLTYSAIGSAVTWAGLSSDTTIIISNDTENRYRYFRILFENNSGEAQITRADLKQWLE